MLNVEAWSDKIQFSSLFEDAWLKHRVSVGMMYKLDLTRTTVVGNVFHYFVNTHILEQTLNPESLQQFLEEQLLDQFLKFKPWKFLDNLDLKLQFHRLIIMNSRFVGEIHDHDVELRCSTELLAAPQKSEGKESCVEKCSNSNKETCATHVTNGYCNKDACAKNLSSPPHRSSLFEKTLILVIPASSSYVDAFSIAVSTIVTRMVRHYDQ